MSPQRRRPAKATTAQPERTAKPRRRNPVSAPPVAPVEQALETDLHADRLIHPAAVRGGAGAALHHALDAVPLLTPFIPVDRESPRLNSSHQHVPRMQSSACNRLHLYEHTTYLKFITS